MQVQITINCTPQPSDDPTSTEVAAPQPTTTTLSFVAPPQIAAAAGPILATFARESDSHLAPGRRSDKRDDKMVRALDNGKFTAFYYAGKQRTLSWRRSSGPPTSRASLRIASRG